MSDMKPIEPIEETQFVCNHPRGCRKVIAVPNKHIEDDMFRPYCPNCHRVMYKVSNLD